jgi:hypothetical protein
MTKWVTMDLNLRPGSDGQVAARVDATSAGVGPANKRLLQDQLNGLQERLVQEFPPGSPPTDTGAVTARVTALKELAELRAQGVLSDDEFENQKRKLLDEA